MELTLGARPLRMTLVLIKRADFACTIESEDGDWPESATIAIHVGDHVWTATLTAAEARFDVDKTLVDQVIAQRPDGFRLTCTDGASDLVWAQGVVAVVEGA